MRIEKMYNEIEKIQNPALGAIVLWRFIDIYNENKIEYNKKLLELVFIVLPIVFNEEISNYIISTRKMSGLNKVIEKMMKDKKVDYIYQINDNIKNMKELTIESLQIAIASRLISVNKKLELQSIYNKNLPRNYKKTKRFIDISEKLGYWLSELNKYEREKILKVRF